MHVTAVGGVSGVVGGSGHIIVHRRPCMGAGHGTSESVDLRGGHTEQVETGAKKERRKCVRLHGFAGLHASEDSSHPEWWATHAPPSQPGRIRTIQKLVGLSGGVRRLSHSYGPSEHRMQRTGRGGGGWGEGVDLSSSADVHLPPPGQDALEGPGDGNINIDEADKKEWAKDAKMGAQQRTPTTMETTGPGPWGSNRTTKDEYTDEASQRARTWCLRRKGEGCGRAQRLSRCVRHADRLSLRQARMQAGRRIQVDAAGTHLPMPSRSLPAYTIYVQKAISCGFDATGVHCAARRVTS